MLKRILPFLDQLNDCSLATLRADALAGLTVALVLIPQSMAYAQLAGMPTYYGLYASFLPPMIAALMGSSRQLATGPVAVVSLMTSASLEPLATAGSEGFVAYAIVLALMVGLFQFLLGVLRLGLVVNFLSHPVVNGFTNAAAIIIATSQLSKLFGVDIENEAHHYQTVIKTIQAAMHYTHWPTFFMGVFAFAIMYGLRRINPRIPNVLVAVSLTTLIAYFSGYERNASVPLSAIASQQARELIEKFNQAVNSLPELAKKRTEMTGAVDQARETHNAIVLLNAEHQASLVTLQIDLLNLDARQSREHLRAMLFCAVTGQDGERRFYRQGQEPGGAPTDGRVWRLRIGNKALNPEKLTMTGGGAVVGAVPRGLPSFSLPSVEFKVILRLLPFAAIISLLGFMEAISIAKAMAAKTGQRLDPNQELIGQGLANILGAASKSFPTSGSFSRSAVNLQAGAVTGFSSAFTSLAVLVVLLFFTPLLYHLPQSVLAAVIMMAVIGLINVSGFVHAWKAQPADGIISIVSFIFTLVFAPHLDKGILIGVGLSLAVFLYKSMRPMVASLARHEDQALRCVTTHGLKECDVISVIRFDGPLFFANSSYLDDQITELMLAKRSLRHILIVCNGVNDIDASGEETLSLLIDRVRSAGVKIAFSGINEAVMKVLLRTHLREKMGEENIFPTMEAAIGAIHAEAHRDVEERACPLTTVCHLA
jgi:MFS superfamily sulfate permease-like transporter